jgi:lipopolysaccharide transport system ATP-binding protein
VQPDILIVDEALSVGDMHFQAKCYQRLARFREQGTTLLLVSHSVEDIVKHCDRAIMLKNGCIEHEGRSRVVTNCYLDELFGKRKEYHSSSSSADPEIVNSILSGIDDKFHSRPGYHKEEHRWGQGGAVILDYLIVSDGEQYPSRIMGNAIVNFYFKVRFDTDFDYVVPGFLIKTLEGIFLYGTNSFISTRGKVRVRVCAGDVKVFRFSLSLALNDGDYLISFGISSGNPLQELIPLERRYDSVLLHVDHALSFWGIVDMNASFQLVDDKTVVN